MSMEVLFVTAQNWKQPGDYQWVNDQTNGGTSIPYNFYAVIKRNGLLIHKIPWVDAQRINLSEKRQSQKVYVVYNCICITFLK